MEEPVKKILQDDREIAELWFPGAGAGFRVGQEGVTRIVAYGEPGLHCELPYFAVWFGDHLNNRVPATTAVVVYKEP